MWVCMLHLSSPKWHFLVLFSSPLIWTLFNKSNYKLFQSHPAAHIYPTLSCIHVLSSPFLPNPILFPPVLANPIPSYPVIMCPILSYPILWYTILSYYTILYHIPPLTQLFSILLYPVLTYPILFYPILFYLAYDI